MKERGRAHNYAAMQNEIQGLKSSFVLHISKIFRNQDDRLLPIALFREEFHQTFNWKVLIWWSSLPEDCKRRASADKDLFFPAVFTL